MISDLCKAHRVGCLFPVNAVIAPWKAALPYRASEPVDSLFLTQPRLPAKPKSSVQSEWHQKRPLSGCKAAAKINFIENVIDLTFCNTYHLAKCGTLEHITCCMKKKEKTSSVLLAPLLIAAPLLSNHSDSTIRVCLESFLTLHTNDRMSTQTQPPFYETHRETILPLALLPEPVLCRKYLLPHAASVNCSHWVSVFAIASGQQIDTEPLSPPQAIQLLN